jgi:hypothetical protein
MDKQQAVRYIHQLLDQDHSQDEIVRLLAEQLHAPQDVVKKFVAQTATAYHNEKAREVEEAKPSWLRDLQSSANVPAQVSPLASHPVTQVPETRPDQPHQIPPWLQENGPMGVPFVQSSHPDTSWQRDQRDYVLQQLEMGRTYGDVADSVAARAGVVPSLARQFVREVDMGRRSQVTATRQPMEDDIPMQAASLNGVNKAKQRSDPLQDPALMEFVLSRLGHSRKNSDVVMAVCERANLSWEEAERVVAQAAIQRHSQGTVRISQGMTFLGVLVAGGGFALAAAFGLPMMAQLGTPYGLHLPFDGTFATSQPALAIALFVGGIILVGFGAGMAYLYYHAAEEQAA